MLCLAALGLFLIRSSRHPASIITISLFGRRVFAWATVAMLLANLTFTSSSDATSSSGPKTDAARC